MTLDQNWFSEPHEPAGSAISFRITKKLAERKTPFQFIECPRVVVVMNSAAGSTAPTLCAAARRPAPARPAAP